MAIGLFQEILVIGLICKMNAREMVESDKEFIAKWCKGHGWPMFPDYILSTRGFIGEYDGKPVFACWLYVCDSPLGFLDWIICDPESNDEEREGSFKAMIDMAWEVGKENGLQRVLTIANHPSLMERLKKNNYFVTDENVTLLMRDK